MQDWTEEAIKRVFLIADAPCHGRSYCDGGDHFPEGSPDGLVLEDLMREFSEKDIVFNVIKLDHSCDKMIEAMRGAHEEFSVKDMTEQRPSASYSYPVASYEARYTDSRCADLMAPAMSMMRCSAMEEDCGDMLESLDDCMELKRRPMMGSYRKESSELDAEFKSFAAEEMVSQVRSKQAMKRAAPKKKSWNPFAE